MSFAKMGILLLNKRRLRTALTILAIILGVGILTGVNVTADSIENAINMQIYARLGSNDIIARGNRSVDGGWFRYDSANEFLMGIDHVKSTVPRIIKSHPSYPIANSSTGWNVATIAIDTTNPKEEIFGVCNITAALDPTFVNTSRIEALFRQYSNLPLPVVLSQDYANAFGIRPGSPFYIFPEDPAFFGGGISITNTSTWFNATVIGIIADQSEAVTDFMPPARIWELSPPGRAVYLDLQTAWSYVFNAHRNYVNMVFLQAENPTFIDGIRKEIANTAPNNLFPGGVFTEDVKSLFTSGILQVNFLMRGIFSIFSGISLLVCAIIIKNLLEMAKEEQTHQIGIMRAIGVTKNKILTLFISQILFISIIGSILGLIFGYFLSSFFVSSYVDTAEAVGTNFANYDIVPVMSPLTVLIGMGSGILVSLIFGFFPARASANVDPLKALKSTSETPQQSLLVRTIKGTGNLGVAIGFTIGGIVIVGSAFGGLFILDIINPEIIAMLFVGVILLIIGIVLLGAFFFPVIVPFLSTLFSPLLRQMRVITARNLAKYSRQSKNTFAMLAIGLCMMITVGTIMNSAYEGAYPGGKTITGGDLAIGNFGQGQIPMIPHTQGLRDLPSVAQAVPIRFSLGFEGLISLDRLKQNEEQTFGGTSASLFGEVRETFHLGIIDAKEYANLHRKDSIVKIERNIGFDPLMTALEEPYTIILQDRFARYMGGIREGERVRLRFEGFEADFEVIGIFEILPGFYWSYYATESTFDKQFCGAISWQSYEQLVDDHIGKADLIARNKVIPPSEYKQLIPDEKLWGYASMPMDYQTLGTLMDQTGLVVNRTQRVTSPFYNIPQFKWATNLTLYDPAVNLSDYDASPAGGLQPNNEGAEILNKTWALQNVLWHEKGAINPDWNSMITRTVMLDPFTDRGFGNTTLKAVLPQIPKNFTYNVEDLFLWAANELPGMNVCVVNEIYVNLNLTTGKWDYIKLFSPGENVRMYYNESIYSDFLIIGTTNSHYPYQYKDDKGKPHSDTGVLNYKALSYNTYTYNSTDWSYFFEVIDAEPNTVFLSNRNWFLPDVITESLIPQLAENLLTNTTQIPEESEYNETYPDMPWWLNYALENMALSNFTESSGFINNSQWLGNYSINGYTFQFDGASITYQDQRQNLSFNVDMPNALEILEQLATGNMTLDLQNLTSVMIFDLKDGMTPSDIKNFIATMESVCRTIPTLENITFFSPKLFLLEESGLFYSYFLIGAIEKDQIGTALLEIKNYYIAHDLPWNDKWVQLATEVESQVGGILGLIVSMFFGVLSFALITSLLGLSISTLISVKKRYAEIGTLRTLGFSNGQILRMIIGEGVITAIIGILVGLIAGLLIAGLIIFNLPFMIFLPIIFAPPYELIAAGLGLLIIAAVGASFIPGIGAVKIDIAEAIRIKGE
jgi:ABC-type antimicrobial peptide transport system permease subunit